MSTRRCPNCGGLVGADAEWCTQCFTRLDALAPALGEGAEAPAEAGVSGGEPTPEAVSAPEPATRRVPPTGPIQGLGERVIRSRGEAIIWDCPACGTENPIDAPLCSACGTPFRQVLKEPEERVDMDPGRAAMLSLIFPGVGHFMIGRRGDGIARGVVFAFALMTGLLTLGAVVRGSGGAYLMLMVLSLAAAAALYVVSTLDAGRAASRLPPLLPMRVLMYGGIGLMLATLGVLVIGAMGARG